MWVAVFTIQILRLMAQYDMNAGLGQAVWKWAIAELVLVERDFKKHGEHILLHCTPSM